MLEAGNLHCIHQWSFAFEVMNNPFTDSIEKIVERCAENQDLQNLPYGLAFIDDKLADATTTHRIHVAHVSSIDQPPWLQKRYFGIRFEIVYLVRA